MTTIERVLLLEGVEVFGKVTTQQLSFIAAITEEISIDADTVIYSETDVADGLYVVISGSVTMSRGLDVIDRITPNRSFGDWALFDDQPRLTKAVTTEPSRLLFLPREDFYEVLADHVDIMQGVFKQLVQRVLRLAAVAEKQDA